MKDNRCSKLIGKNIRGIRIAKGLTQMELGKRCGMADSSIGVYERGESNPRPETLKRIANALEVSVEKLLKDK